MRTEMRSSWLVQVALTPTASVRIGRRKGHTGPRGGGHVKTEAEAGAMWPQACEWPGPPEARGGGKGPPLEPPEGGGAADPWRQTSGRPQDRESRTGCCGSPAVARGGPRMPAQAETPPRWGRGSPLTLCPARGAGRGPGPGPLPPTPMCLFTVPFPDAGGTGVPLERGGRLFQCAGRGRPCPSPGNEGAAAT